jgi:hypothetical protein
MKTKVGNYIKTATYYTITNATTTPTVVSDPKAGAIYTHCIFIRSENGGGNLYLQRPRRRRQKTFSDPVRVNDKEGEAGNSGGLHRETAKRAHTPALDWMQQYRRRNWRSCNRISAWLGHNLTLVLAVGLAFAVGYVYLL